MLRTLGCLVMMLALPPLLGAAVAAGDKKDEKGEKGKTAERPHMHLGSVVKTDVAKHTITLKTRGKDGKEEETTIELKEGVKLIGVDGKEDKEGHFLKELHEGERLLIIESEGKVVSVRDLPRRRGFGFATVVKTDAAKHTVTVKVRGRDGKEEKTIELKEGIKLIGEDGKEDKEGHFLKELKEGEAVMIIERGGAVVEIRDLPARPTLSIGAVTHVDAAKHTLTVKVKAKDGKEEEKTVEVKEGVKLMGKEHKFSDFAVGDRVVLVEREGKLVAVGEWPLMRQLGLGSVVKTDAAKHTITLKMRGKDGKEEERTIELKEGVKLIGEDGKEDKEGHFLKELEPGERVLITEREGRVVSVRDLRDRRKIERKEK
jgi:hypothetical protein